MKQAQYSTAEQLTKLKALVIDAEYDLNKITERDVNAFIALASKNGLYDAADLIYDRVYSRGGEEWLCASLLDW